MIVDNLGEIIHSLALKELLALEEKHTNNNVK